MMDGNKRKLINQFMENNMIFPNLPTRGGCIPTVSLACSSFSFKIRFSQMFTKFFFISSITKLTIPFKIGLCK